MRQALPGPRRHQHGLPPALPALRLTLDQIEAEHLPPFRDAIAAGVKSVMTAHIVVPELGPAPATLNPASGSLLRGLGFEGLHVTDALDMAAIRATTGSGRGAVLALLAGADLLCLGNPATSGDDVGTAAQGATHNGDGDCRIRSDEAAYLEVRDALLSAVDDGTLPVGLLRDAGRRGGGLCPLGPGRRGCGAARGAGSGIWVQAAARACSVSHPAGADPEGTVALPPGTRGVLLVDARRGHNQAAGRTADLFAAALADYVAVATMPASDLPGPGRGHPTHAAPARGESVVVLVGSLAAGSHGLAAAQSARSIPGAVCINTGVTAPPDPPLPTLNCFGSSRATAQAAARILCGTVAGASTGRGRGDPGDQPACKESGYGRGPGRPSTASRVVSNASSVAPAQPRHTDKKTVHHGELGYARDHRAGTECRFPHYREQAEVRFLDYRRRHRVADRQRRGSRGLCAAQELQGLPGPAAVRKSDRHVLRPHEGCPHQRIMLVAERRRLPPDPEQLVPKVIRNDRPGAHTVDQRVRRGVDLLRDGTEDVEVEAGQRLLDAHRLGVPDFGDGVGEGVLRPDVLTEFLPPPSRCCAPGRFLSPAPAGAGRSR